MFTRLGFYLRRAVRQGHTAELLYVDAQGHPGCSTIWRTRYRVLQCRGADGRWYDVTDLVLNGRSLWGEAQ